jgi:hypothetical protein
VIRIAAENNAQFEAGAGIAMAPGLDGRREGVRVPVGARSLSLIHVVLTASIVSNGYPGLFLQGKAVNA